jgi:hypothetical protein
MSSIDAALDAACVLLTEDHFLVEAFSACRRGRVWFRPGCLRDQVEVDAHLDKVELEASNAANLCANAGLSALAECCTKIANRVSLAKRQGTCDCDATVDLQSLTCEARRYLAAVEVPLSV